MRAPLCCVLVMASVAIASPVDLISRLLGMRSPRAVARMNDVELAGCIPHSAFLLNARNATVTSSNASTTLIACEDATCASACSRSWVSWSSAAAAYTNSNAQFVTVSSIVSYSETLSPSPVANSSGSILPSCTGDPFPRFSGSVGFSASTNVLLPATTSTFFALSTSIATNFSEPTPVCEIQPQQCVDLRNEWHATHELSFPFNVSWSLRSEWLELPMDYPHCQEDESQPVEYDTTGCWITSGAARVFYWPAAVYEGYNDTCPVDGADAPVPMPSLDNGTAPVTQVVTLSDNNWLEFTTVVTMTSPTMYISLQDVEARSPPWGFRGGPIPATVVAVDPADLTTMEISPPLITNAALSSSAMSVIANREYEKFTDLFGLDWRKGQGESWVGPNLQMRAVPLNTADLGRPPPPLSYYYGAVGYYCMYPEPFGFYSLPISAGIYGGLPCNTIYNDLYRPWLQVPALFKTDPFTYLSTCNLLFGWDPPSALTQVQTVAGPTLPTPLSPTSTNVLPPNTNSPAAPGSGSPPGPSPTTPAQGDQITSLPATNSPSPTRQTIDASPSNKPNTVPQGDPQPEQSSSDANKTPPGSPTAPAALPNQGTTISEGRGTPTAQNDSSGQPGPRVSATDQFSSPDTNPATSDPTSSADLSHASGVAQPMTVATIGSGSAAVTVVVIPPPTAGPDIQDPESVLLTSAGGETILTPNQVITVAGQTISVATSGSVVFNPGSPSASTVVIPNIQASPVTVTPVAVLGSIGSGISAMTFLSDPANPSAIIITSAGGATTVTDGSAVTLNGETISAQTTGGVVLNPDSASETTLQLPTTQTDSVTQTSRPAAIATQHSSAAHPSKLSMLAYTLTLVFAAWL